jgi:TPR repeat protein
MVFYKKAAEFGDVMALNNIGLMLEQGYEEFAPKPDEALANYK